MRWSPRRSWFTAAAVAGTATVALPFWSPWVWNAGGDAREAAPGGMSSRPRSPLASVASSIEWIRFSAALKAGDEPRAYAIARGAIEMDTASPAGWKQLAGHFLFERSSVDETDGPEERRAMILAGLGILAEGEPVVSRPQELSYEIGLVAHYFATLDEAELPWPECRRELLAIARDAFIRAMGDGHRAAVEALEILGQSERKWLR